MHTRRKLFAVLLAFILLVFTAEWADIRLYRPAMEDYGYRKVWYEGEVKEFKAKGSQGYDLKVLISHADGKKLSRRENVQITYRGDLSAPWRLLHSKIRFSATLTLPEEARNPRCFDYRKYMKSRGVFYIGSSDELSLVSDIGCKEGALGLLPSAIVEAVVETERFLLEKKWRFQEKLSDDAKGVTMGILFGDTSFIDEEDYEDFRRNGTAHVLAVSGLHVGILYGIYKKILGKRHSAASIVLFEIFLWMYGTLSLWSPSTTRAIIMVSMSLIGKCFDLRYDILTAASFAALILMLKNPYVIFGTSFQMSFLAIASIAFLNPVLSDKIPEVMKASIAVNIGLMMYQIAQFNTISLVSVFVNIPIVFLTGYMVPLALSAFALWIFAGDAVMAAALPVMELGAKLMFGINGFATLGGYGAVDVKSLPAWLSVAIFLAVFFLCSEKFYILKNRGAYRKMLMYFAAFATVALISGTFLQTKLDKSDIVFIDVGQGDAVHIRCGAKNVLIDGGGKKDYNVGEKVLKPYFLKNGVDKLDFALATHMHMDHYKGLEELGECFKIDVSEQNLTAGKRILIDEGVFVDVLWPLTIDLERGQEENWECSVLMLNYDGLKVLVTGDLDEKGEREMAEHYSSRKDLLRADVIKIGHHGSKTSTGEAFLDLVRPKAAIIQVGKNNYGHPAPITIEKCRKRGIMVFRNDENGAVGLEVERGDDGEARFAVRTMIGEDCDRW